jgi:6-phosphogluconolactonase/glucosamine-6-phosphate isomerase/deaminase
MHYIPTTGWEDGTADLTKRLIHELSTGKRVLWLVSGGSNISSSIIIMQHITTALSQQLTIGLIDERFGPVGHEDSNWQQLLRGGLKTKSATILPVLIDGLNLDETADTYNQSLSKALEDHDVIIGQVGIGADGHIAGILPGSDAAQEADRLVVGYESTPFERITTTPLALAHVNLVYAFAFGDSKHDAIARLQNEDLPVVTQPAQLLKHIPETYIYSDQLKGE